MIQSRHEIPSVRGGTRILRALSTAGRPLGVSELSRALALAKASVFRIVATLEMESFVERVEGNAFRVGRAAFEVGSAYAAYAAYADMESVFRTVAQRLVAEHNETVQLAVLAGTENIYVGKEDSSQPVRLVSQMGTRLPAHITELGKAMLSCLSESELQALYGDGALPQMAPNSHTSLTSLLQDLRQIRVRGEVDSLLPQQQLEGVGVCGEVIYAEDQGGREASLRRRVARLKAGSAQSRFWK